jgi:thioredoxin reductase
MIGAGSAGLYMAMEAMFDNIQCHVLETEGSNEMDGDEKTLVDYLKAVISEYLPCCMSGDTFNKVDKNQDGTYIVSTHGGDFITCKYILFTEHGKYLN